MANTTKTNKKLMARIVYPRPNFVQGTEDTNCTHMSCDGEEYIVLFERPSIVPIPLAEHLVDIGEIKFFDKVEH
ncbi:MAG: hypothetical protein J6I69_02365 [Bacilli bacterium]|nr:hypothetical protein [Bacilli bacterium]